MNKSNKNVTKLLFSVIITAILLFAGSCQNWMSNDDFMQKIENEVHDANATQIKVYVRYANQMMGTTEPSGNTTMKVDVASRISAITNDDYGFVRWAAFTTKDFPTGKQHSSLLFVTEEDYNTKYKPLELPDSLVHFVSPTSPTTEVKIFTSQNDIFIIPIVAARPAYVQSVPAAADSNIVKNTSIRILFSKPIDEKSLYDDEGNLNYSITTSTSVFSDDETEMVADDITDKFVHKLSDSGKMLTLSLKTEIDEETQAVIKQELLDNRQRITVTLFEGICDRYGYSMNGSFSFNFQTGTNTDSLAPMIEVIYGGTGDVCDVFVTFGEDFKMAGNATKASKAASKTDVASEEYTDELVAQRVYDKLNIFVKANDIIASGSNEINPAKDLSEDNVATIGISASLFYDKDGKPIQINKDNSSEFSIGKKNYIYISGAIDKDAEIDKLFTEVAPLDKDGNKYTGGTIYTYDVSSLPDGLIRIDVWGIDMTGNSGETDKGAPYVDKHDNGFKSIFVVKDTTPIDSNEVKAKKKVVSNSISAPYYWYNNDTLKTMQLFDTQTNKITDYGHVRLRSLDENLYWYFGVGDESKSTPDKDSKKWVRIHDATTGESIPFPLENAVAPESDGPVDITLFLKDDMGNVSIPVLLDSIMYDNTKPTVTLLDNYGDFVKSDGSKDLHASKETVIRQILKVSFTEPNENNAGSGIRRMEIHVKKGNTEVEVPLSQDASNPFKVKWTSKTGSAANPADAKEIKIAANDEASTNNIKVFDVNDSSKITTGTLFIYGITLGDEDGNYTVLVDLFDSAMNQTPATAKTLIALDTTAPEIEQVKVVDVQARTVYGDTTETKTWWLPKDKFENSSDVNSALNKVSLTVKVDEFGSGLEVLKVSKDIEFTAQTKLKLGTAESEEYLMPDVDYQLDYVNNTIKLLNNYNVILKGTSESPIVFTLENVKFKKINNASGNKVALEVVDFVQNAKSNKAQDSADDYQVYYNDTTTGTLVFADSTPPQITELRIEDSAHNDQTNPYRDGGWESGWDKDNYTDSRVVALVLTLKAEDLTNGSGVKTIHLSDNAEFTSSTKIYVDDATAPLTSSEYSIAADKKSVTFTKVFTAANVIRFENVQIVSDAEGYQTVKADLTDFVGLDTVASKESSIITYDSIAPVINEDGINWIPDNSLVSYGNVQTEEVTDQTLKVDFTEETAGVKVIRFDIDYEGGADSYEWPFSLHDFNLLYNGSSIDFNRSSDGRYLLLKNPFKSGTFEFKNIKLRDDPLEGKYNVKITLLDAAENKNPQDSSAVYKKEIFMDTTAPVINEVRVIDAKPRTVYGDSARTTTWWMPYEKFDETKTNLSKVTFQISVDEAGTGLKYIKLAQDIEFTNDTKLFIGSQELVKNTDYTLDVSTKTITLLNHREPKLKGTAAAPETVFTLQNVKLNKINTNAGNKAALTVFDFVNNFGSNRAEGSTDDYTVYYDNTTTTGTLIYADNTPPAIATLYIEDSAQNTTTNPDNKAYDKDNYTNTQDVILTLTLSAENATDGSGVKTIQLSDNAEFTNATTITVDDILLPASDYTFAADNKSVDFDNVFTQANVIKFTNVHIISAEEGAQIVKADLTDFVGINTTASTDSNEIIFDSVNPVVTAINWNTTDPLVAKGKVQTQDVTDQTLSVDFTEETAGTKVIRFDIDYENAPDSDSYETPFDLSNFEIKYGNTTLVKDTDYTISDGRYIILNQPKYSGTFNFNNLKIRDTNDEGEYTIKITLLDAAENKNPQAESSVFKKSIFMDTTAPVVSSVTVAGAQARTVYGDASETKTWWLPYSKFEAKNNLSKVDLNIAVNEAGSGLKIIKLSQDVEFTENTQLLAGGVQLTKGTDYALDLTNHTITLFNYDNPVLRNTTGANGAITYSQFTLKNVKLNRINTSAGNTVGFTVADWVANAGSNQIDSTSDYKIYYNSIENGTRIFADDTEPEITAIKIEDSAQESSVNPDNKAYDKTHYTNTQDVVLTLSLKAESLSNGSGVKTIHLSNNAEFTSSTQIFVDDATDALTSGDSGDYTIAQDNKSVTFKKVFTDANVIKFTNVHIISSTQGEQTLGADLTDFVGLNTVQSKSPDSLIYDSVAPVVSSIHWVTNQPGVTLGSDKDWKVDTQALQIAFTEATAGVKVIKFDIHLLDQTASYANPFENTDFALSYNGTVLAKGTDYTITADDSSNSAARYIILASPKPTGTFKFENLQLNNQEIEGTYVIDVALLDAAENRVNTTKSIAIDKVVPVITEDIRIPNLIEAYQLTTSGIGSTKEYWLPTSYINGTVKAPDAIPVYVKIQENGSGIKVITFGNNATLSANTTLWMVASDGTETAVPSSYYEVNSTNKTITIIDSNNALNAGAAVADFEILVKNVGFANTDSAYGDTNAHFSSNSINVKVSDVAMNETAVRGTTETLIYSDSRTPAKPTEFKLLDRASATDGSSTDGAPSIEAEENYTNDSIVNMEFNLDTSEVYGSGYHQFVITNASFIPESTTVEMTKISPSGSGSISGIAFVLSEDNKTLTLKTNDAEPKNLVVRDAVKVTIKNVQLDNATSGDNKSVTVKVRDLIGRESPVATDDIWFDNTKPELYKLFAANYSKDTSTSCPEYYKPAINVYPHADVENAEGVLANYGTESSPKNIPTFYTATTYNTDYTYYTYKGQLSRSSSSLLQDFTYGAVLGFHATDNTKLSGYVSAATTFLHYIQDDDFTKTASDILGTSINSGRKNPATDINNNTTRQYESLWFGIPTGHYSAVIVDEAGNVSDVFRFAVVKDTEKPTTTNLNDRVLFARPGEDYNVYRNTAAAPSDESAFENGFKASSSITSGVNGGGIRTKKFVTKETSDKKYKLILKLGENYNASNLITNMQGESVSSSISTSKYEDLDGTSSSAPIEQYLISTWYGEWPSSYQSQGTHGYSYAYKPLVPNGTTFPSGQTLNTTSTLSTTDYQDVRNYFGYSDAFTSRMRVYDNGSNPYTSWHSYSHPAGSDGTKYTDYGNSITSYVDSDNNLVIELPPKSTAPVSVFLRDGCGNMTYVVCGLETEQSGSYTWTETTENPDDPENPVSTLHTVNYTYQVAPSFIIDNWLGWKQTTNGVNMEPIIRQNPHMLYVSSSSNVRWPDWTLTSTTGYAGYKWSYNTGNGDQGGEGEAFGHIKDHVKKATYYNPNISDNRTTVTNSSDNKFKLGLTLYFKQSDEDGSGTDSTVHPEDILWDTSLGKTDSTTDYSTRALLYCTQSSNRPDYDDIVKSHRYDQVSYGDTGFRTDWTAIRISSATTAGVTILLDYPEPDYDTLGWVVNDPVTHEPIPHYMWYVYEDRVGNYEIGKVVNSTETDREVLAGTKASSTVYDKWLFDGKKPTLAIRGTITSTNKTGTSPADIASNQTAVNSLVAANNGYVPYYAGLNNVYVRVTNGEAFRADSLKNLTTGYGTTHVVEDATNGRINEPFMDLEVSEITGIRGFAWSNDSTPPALSHSSTDYSTGNTHGDSGKWYVGYSASALYADIGCGFYYGGSETNVNGGNASNSYFSFTDDSSSYKGVYSGTKVNTVIPKSKLSDTGAKQLYLHVMDWTGNISTYKMGESLYFINDTTGPGFSGTSATTDVDSKYYVSSSNGGISLRIAGNEDCPDTITVDGSDIEGMKIRFPSAYFSDSGAGLAGFVLASSYAVPTVNHITSDNDGIYLWIPRDVYETWPDDSTGSVSNEVSFYAFDKLGNYHWNSTNNVPYLLTGILDKTSPAYDSVSFVTKEGEGTEFIHSTPTITDANGHKYNDIKTVGGYGKVTDFKAKTGTTKLTSTTELEAGVTAGKVQEVWVNELNTSRFHINLTSNITDFRDAIIRKWNGSAWTEVSSWKNRTTTDSWNHGGVTYRPDLYNLLNFADTGTYYQIDVSDLAGNHSYQYFKLYLDEQGPSLTTRTGATSTTPQIELGKGSINSVGPDNNKTYYYTADSSYKATINFAMTDDNSTGKGIKNSAQKLYYSFDPDALTEAAGTTPSKWTEIASPTDGTTDVSGLVASGDLDKIYLKDILGNTRTVDVDFSYTYTNAAGTTDTEVIPKLTYYAKDSTTSTYYNDDGTPKVPDVTEGTLAKWNDKKHDYDYYPIVNQITTYGIGYNDNVENSNTAIYTKFYSQLLSDGVILIKSRDREKLKISFTKPEGIIGYLVTDENENPVQVTQYTTTGEEGNQTTTQEIVADSVINDAKHTGIGSYSFTTTLATEFEETLPMILSSGLNGNYKPAKRKYWAVDVVGNISSTPLILEYSYDDPNMAQDISLIQSIDDVTEADVKALMQEDIANHTLSFANFAVKEGPNIAGSKDNKKGKVYFNNDFIVLRCTLKGKADTFSEAPALVELWDVWNGGKRKRGSSIDIRNQTGDYSDKFKVYASDEHTNPTDPNEAPRYYCYIAFKLDKATLNYNNKLFDNNDTYGGSVIYAKIYGKIQAESDVGYLQVKDGNTTVTAAKNYGWWIDQAGPSIANTNYYFTGDNVKKLKGYYIAEGSSLLDGFNKAKDNSIGNGYETNIYNNGTRISYEVGSDTNPNFKDALTRAAKYEFVTSDGFTAVAHTYDTGWTPFTTAAGHSEYYDFNLPVINEPHKHLALFIMDAVGNISDPYYLVDKTNTSIAWWLTDHNPQNVAITITKDEAEVTPTFEPGTTQYVLNVAMDPGAVIKTITADKATITGVEFNGYTEGQNPQPTYNASTGKFANDGKWLNISGMKVTINVAQTWYDQDVKLNINGTAYNVFTIPYRKLSSANVTLTPVTAAQWTAEATKYIPITLNDNAPLTLLSDSSNNVTFSATVNDAAYTGLTAELDVSDTDNPKIKLTGLPETKKWAQQVIKVSMSGNSINGTITKTAVTIPAIDSGDITLKLGTTELTGENGFATGTEDYTITIETTDTPTSVTCSDASVTATWDSATPNTVTLTGVKKQWSARDINLVINNVTKKVFNVPAIGTGDITLKLGNTVLNGSNGFAANTSTYEITIEAPDTITSTTTITCTGLTTNDLSRDSEHPNVVTLSNVKKKWTARDVELVINGVTKKVFNVPNIEASDIKLVQGSGESQTSGDTIDWSSGTPGTGANAGKTVFTFKIASPAAVPAATEENPTVVSATNATATFDSTAQSVTLTVSQDWDTHTVDLTVNGVTKTGILAVPAKLVTGDDISWTAVTTVASDGTYNIPITIEAGALARLGESGVTITTGVQGVTATLNTTDADHPKFVITSGPTSQTWSDQNISISISGTGIVDGTITKSAIAIPAKTLTADDITIGDAAIPEGGTDYIVELTLDEGVPVGAITSVSADNNVNAAFVTNDGNVDKTKVVLTNIPAASWGVTKKITLKINNDDNITKEVLTIAAKTATESDITFAIYKDNALITEYADNLYSLLVDITTAAEGLSIKGASIGETALQKNSGKYVIDQNVTTTPIASDLTLTVKTNGGNVSKTLFTTSSSTPDPEENTNIFFGRSAILNANQEVYTFVDTPSSVAALQTRIIELPQTIQKVWETYNDSADEIVETASKVAKKSKTKKASKKAAKDLVDQTTEVLSPVAQTVAEVVEQTTAQIEVKELPVEALAVPAVEDQVAMLLPQTANTKPVAEPQASVSPGTTDSTIVETEPAERSNAALWIILVVLCTAIAGVVLSLKKKRV